MAVRYGTFRICVLPTSHLEPYRTSVAYFSSIFEAYRTNVPYPYHYKKGVPYFWANIEAYLIVLQHLDVLRGRLLGSHVNFHWQLGGQNNHQPCSSNDISHCSSSQLSTELFRAFSSHRQPSAIFSKVFPPEQTSWPNWQTLMACRKADA